MGGPISTSVSLEEVVRTVGHPLSSMSWVVLLMSVVKLRNVAGSVPEAVKSTLGFEASRAGGNIGASLILS